MLQRRSSRLLHSRPPREARLRVWCRERMTNRHPGRHVSKQEPLAWGAPASGDVRREFLRGLPSLLRPRAPSTGWASVVIIRPQARASARRSARRVERHVCGSPLRAMAETHTRLPCRRECKDGRESLVVHEVPRRRPFTESQAHILRILRASDVADATRYASGCPTRPVDLRPPLDVFPAQNLPRGTSEPRPDRQRASGPSGQWPLPANQPCRG